MTWPFRCRLSQKYHSLFALQLPRRQLSGFPVQLPLILPSPSSPLFEGTCSGAWFYSKSLQKNLIFVLFPFCADSDNIYFYDASVRIAELGAYSHLIGYWRESHPFWNSSQSQGISLHGTNCKSFYFWKIFLTNSYDYSCFLCLNSQTSNELFWCSMMKVVVSNESIEGASREEAQFWVYEASVWKDVGEWF